ncbi:MAG TPA: tetratricopeptide repeat protein [Acidobacteriaceae bacterium]|nr:tetratricopeptide repeat protein [Acidobacteriaceae bacterium]
MARIAQPQMGGSAITLETSQPLFYLAASLNACGYDAGLADSSPVRRKIREEMDEELAGSAPARDARDALCGFIRSHALNDVSRSLARYVSLALYLGPPPMLTPTVDETELPPDSTQVVEVLLLVRTFAETVHLEALWREHRAEYDGFIDRIHDPITRMMLDTNVYLHLPLGAFEGRRFLVLLEPMLSPAETNARYNGVDSVIVVSPAAQPADAVPMDLIRHTYLHFTVEPLVYSRSRAMDRLLPLLKPVQGAPLENIYKSDITALVTECLIKAIETQTMDVGIPKPKKPEGLKERADYDRYNALVSAYERQAEAVRRKAVELEMRQGWVLIGYFYDQLGLMAKDSASLKDNIGELVYGMDVDREVLHAKQTVFLAKGSGGDVAFRDPVRRSAAPLSGLELAEMKLMKGDLDGAADLADEALKGDSGNAEADYVLGRIDLMQGHPDDALDHLTKTVRLSHDPRTIAWAHIYLGRMYDIARDPNDPEVILPQREKAVAEYRAALANRDSEPDTKAAAELGIKQAFTLPKREAASSDGPVAGGETEKIDPTGKAEKESYRPTPSR